MKKVNKKKCRYISNDFSEIKCKQLKFQNNFVFETDMITF